VGKFTIKTVQFLFYGANNLTFKYEYKLHETNNFCFWRKNIKPCGQKATLT